MTPPKRTFAAESYPRDSPRRSSYRTGEEEQAAQYRRGGSQARTTGGGVHFPDVIAGAANTPGPTKVSS
jgi:hypothetical protein